MSTQSQNQPNSPIAAALLQEFQHEVGITRRFLQRLPEDKLSWRPHEKSMTAGQLALHLAQVPQGVLRLVQQDEATPPDFSHRQEPTSLRQILDQLDQSEAYVGQSLPQITDQRMQEIFKVAQGGQTIMAMPRATFLRMVMFNHWYQHRGQFGVYLRLLGATVPSSYGPSADEGRAG